MGKEFKGKGDADSLHEIYGGKAFVKIKQALAIEKILFSVVSLENSKDHVDIYMDVKEFGAILMGDVRNGSLFRRMMVEKDKGDKYPASVYSSPYGGGNYNGNPVSRYFTIAPGSSQEVVLTAFAYPAIQENGKYVPVKGSKASLTLRVGFAYSELRKLEYAWRFLEDDFMHDRYCLEKMKSTWTPNEDTEEIQTSSTIPQPKSESSTETKQKPSEEIVTLKVRSKTKILERQKKPGDYAMTVENPEQTDTYNVVFTADVIQHMDKGMFAKFCNKANDDNGNAVSFVGVFKKGKEGNNTVYYFQSFATN